MSLFLACIAGTVISYLLGVRTPGTGYGTPLGWIATVLIGLVLGLLYYVFSAYGLLFSLDSLLSGF